MKNTLIFTYSTNILVRLLTVNMKNCLTPKNPKISDSILVTLLKMRPNFSQSSRENATPSSVTSPLASYKEVPPRDNFPYLKREMFGRFNTECSSRKTSVTGQFITSKLLEPHMSRAGIDITVDSETQ